MQRKNFIMFPDSGISTLLALMPVTWVALFARLITVLSGGVAGGVWGFLLSLLTTQVTKRYKYSQKKVGVQNAA
ncbi:hypothetical protein [Dethiobacter alkaliphilus]|uniref:hypothetical protein n=1 Tax=Dethiobacter alkaliphilus TaxID=427926 RepID=UPI002225E85E|nr:hypothetical protein [Dethiobacter alkaliphilus]MCW3490957.1 hypothetical protein [Dethiobacter alkaliphilus]